jgi:hypothetical protein
LGWGWARAILGRSRFEERRNARLDLSGAGNRLPFALERLRRECQLFVV